MNTYCCSLKTLTLLLYLVTEAHHYVTLYRSVAANKRSDLQWKKPDEMDDTAAKHHVVGID